MKKWMIWFAISLLGAAQAIGVPSALADPGQATAISDFTLKDFRGKSHSLSDFVDQRLVVVAFLGTECPLAKLYGKRLAEMQADYDQAHPGEVAFLGVMSNRQDAITEIAAYARIHKIAFPLLKDLNHPVADQFGANRTPQAFLLGPVSDDGSRRVLYQGRIDDQYGIGYVNEKPRRRDLAIAVDEALAGKPVSQPSAEAVGCIIGRKRKADPDAEVTYCNQIASILQKRCVQCHRDGEIAPFALTDFDEVVGWAEMIQEVVQDRRMPPWHANPEYGDFENDCRMTDEEKQMIDDWVAAGAPEGDPSDLPDPPEYATGWMLPREPDAVIYADKKPYTVPAEGVIEYRYTSAETHFEEDKWISAAEIVPGSRAVVHHVIAFVRRPGQRGGDFSGARGGFLAAYVPGLVAQPFPKGMAKFVPAGSDIIFQMHYTPVGSPQKDRTKIGLVFADPAEVTHLVSTSAAVQPYLRIPPREDDYQVEAKSPAHVKDVLLLGLMPHMHLRGKAFSYEALYPDGQNEMLLDVPNYDFNWQTAYRLTQPKLMPAGTRIRAVAHYDNSEKNLANPDPDDVVRWGEQTWDEMMIGYFDFAIAIEDAGRLIKSDLEPKHVTRSKLLMRFFDKDGDDKITREEAPKEVREAFEAIDVNDDEVVTFEELSASLKKKYARDSSK